MSAAWKTQTKPSWANYFKTHLFYMFLPLIDMYDDSLLFLDSPIIIRNQSGTCSIENKELQGGRGIFPLPVYPCRPSIKTCNNELDQIKIKSFSEKPWAAVNNGLPFWSVSSKTDPYTNIHRHDVTNGLHRKRRRIN